MEDKYIFLVKVEEKTKIGTVVKLVPYLMMHRDAVSVEEIIQCGKELGCVE